MSKVIVGKYSGHIYEKPVCTNSVNFPEYSECTVELTQEYVDNEELFKKLLYENRAECIGCCACPLVFGTLTES